MANQQSHQISVSVEELRKLLERCNGADELQAALARGGIQSVTLHVNVRGRQLGPQQSAGRIAAALAVNLQDAAEAVPEHPPDARTIMAGQGRVD